MENNPIFYPGHHVLADYYGCTASLLDDVRYLEDTLLQAARLMQATVVDVRFNQFNPIGVSGVIIIAESHLTIHTWPEHGFAAVDFFTCGSMDADAALLFIQRALAATRMETKRLLRGEL
jgi:S-adenosylmethionine decarboxylase